MLRFVALILGAFLTAAFNVTSAAKADWRTGLGTFRVGLVASGNRAEAQRRIEPFRLALAEALGMEVEIFFAKDYATLIGAQLATRIEYAIMSTTAYSVTWLKCQCIEPLVIPMGSDQSKSYRAILISDTQGTSNISNLKPAQVLHPALDVLGGFTFAAYELARDNIVRLDNESAPKMGPEELVERFLESPDKVLLGWSSLTGNPSTGYTRGTLRSLASKLNRNVTGYKIIWKSSDIPHPPHVVKKSLHKEAKEILLTTLRPMFERDPVAYDAVEPVFGGGFAPAKHGQYENYIEFIRETLQTESNPDDKAVGQ